MTLILGLSAYYHDSAATLIQDGEILCAFQEERFSRIKQDKRFPYHAIKACLNHADITIKDLDGICYYEDPELKYDRIITTFRRNRLKGAGVFAKEIQQYRKNRKILKTINQELQQHFGEFDTKITCAEHHQSHAASAYYPSPFSSSAVLCVDGVGEWATISAWHGKGIELEPLWSIDFPDSLGLLYSAFTYFCGFKVDSGEYKLMGLAPYGEPVYAEAIHREIISVADDGSFSLNRDYFDYEVGTQMTSPAFDKLFGGPRRKPETEITQREMDLAASVQVVTEDVLFKLVERLQRETGERNLCLAGGVALNCVANGNLLQKGPFSNLFIQPASGDSGCSLGAAYVEHFRTNPDAKKFASPEDLSMDAMQGSYLGNAYGTAEIRTQLEELGATFEVLGETELVARTTEALSSDKVVGWFQGRMEFGPRALGGRSILGNPRSRDMQRNMNLKIKNRESFRPFAPAILAEQADNWFELDAISPYMLIVANLRQDRRLITATNERRTGLDKVNEARAEIPAVVHVDYSARVQTVDGKQNPIFRKLIEAFYQETDCPILINTSFNVRGEPIVESPMDAFTCFMRTEMDCLVVGSLFLEKTKQAAWVEDSDWRKQYELD
ncbi:MAG: carbamoyltransferase [Pseudoruegeria sp.]